MSKHAAIALALLIGLFLALSLRADDEAGNSTYVKSSTHGERYAKCVPGERYGSKGATRIYLVRDEQDVLETTYEWYTPTIYLHGTDRGGSVVRFGPWHRGRKASQDDLAVAFYLSGKLLRQYSTLDIAGRDNVSQSVSHYQVFGKVIGYRHVEGADWNTWAFDVEGINGKVISFDAKTGEIRK
jgi:hypothetical protein